MSTRKRNTDGEPNKLVLPKPHPGQQRVLDEAKRFNILNCGRRWGKNYLLHNRVVDDLMGGRTIGWGSPSYKNLSEDWRVLLALLMPIVRTKNEQERRIETITGGVLEMWSLDNPDVIRSRGYNNFYINEAAYVPNLIAVFSKVLRPLLTDKKGGLWVASTPNGMNGYHTMYTWGNSLPDWRSWTFTSYDNPYLDPKELDDAKKTQTEEEWRQETMAEFIQNEGAVFRNIVAATTAIPDDLPIMHRGHYIVAGADWANENDFTALSIACVECEREVALDRFHELDYFFQLQRLEILHNEWGVKLWEVELNAMGQPIYQEMQRMGLPVRGFNTTMQSKNTLIRDFALAVEKGDVRLLPDLVATAELQAYRRSVSENGNARYSAPDGMHDDTVISRALMWRAMKRSKRAAIESAQDTSILGIQARGLQNWFNQRTLPHG